PLRLRPARPPASLPTRRSADLLAGGLWDFTVRRPLTLARLLPEVLTLPLALHKPPSTPPSADPAPDGDSPTDEGEDLVVVPRARSEEHTSELQSRFDLVCRLLL